MPCPLTKYLGTEFCPEFAVDAPFAAAGSQALQALYNAMTGAVPKFSRDMLEKALEAIPVAEEPKAEEAEVKTDEETSEEEEADEGAEDKEATVNAEAVANVEATTKAEAEAKKHLEAQGMLKELNENIKKMNELREKLEDTTLSADEKRKVQKEIVAEAGRQIEAAQLRRDPNEEVLENLWSFFRPEMLSTYKKSGCYMDINSNRQMWMIRAMWLQFALSPKTTYFSKIDAYGATYFGKKPLPDEYLSLATLKLANEKFDEYIELY